MTEEQVLLSVGKPDGIRFFSASSSVPYMFDSEWEPPDLLLTLPDRAKEWGYGYWISATDRSGVGVYFSNDGHVIGWARGGDATFGKYEHEQVTSRLSRGMREEYILRILGQPDKIVRAPKWGEWQRVRELYADHYWSVDPLHAGVDAMMWEYRYSFGNGSVRTVYLLWGSKLLGWGYDHAHDEAVRYRNERG
ncbi:MAG: hypothetical protein ISP90_04465 [Nevskia sp.]|nr:hypothetical protein [Nevskia sp.]